MKELPLPKCIATEKYNMYLHLPLENQRAFYSFLHHKFLMDQIL
jgi:hypothetical protein